jgi:hypothetical protein
MNNNLTFFDKKSYRNLTLIETDLSTNKIVNSYNFNNKDDVVLFLNNKYCFACWKYPIDMVEEMMKTKKVRWDNSVWSILFIG